LIGEVLRLPTDYGLNERFWSSLEEAGVYDNVRTGLDRVLAYLNSL
jgi:hypothetical protein